MKEKENLEVPNLREKRRVNAVFKLEHGNKRKSPIKIKDTWNNLIVEINCTCLMLWVVEVQQYFRSQVFQRTFSEGVDAIKEQNSK